MLEHHVAVEAESGHEVDPVKRRLEERRHRWRDHKADDDFKREPNVAHQLHVEERVMRKSLARCKNVIFFYDLM